MRFGKTVSDLIGVKKKKRDITRTSRKLSGDFKKAADDASKEFDPGRIDWNKFRTNPKLLLKLIGIILVAGTILFAFILL